MNENKIIDNIVDIEGKRIGQEKLDQFRNYKYFIASGAPGSGKTTLLGEMEQELSDIPLGIVYYDSVLRVSREPDTIPFNNRLVEVVRSHSEKTLVEIPACGITIPKNRGVSAFINLAKEDPSTGVYIVTHPLLPLRRGMIIKGVVEQTAPELRTKVLVRDFGINVVVTKGSIDPYLVGERIAFLVEGMANEDHIKVIQNEISRMCDLWQRREPEKSRELIGLADKNLPDSYRPDAILELVRQTHILMGGSGLIDEDLGSWVKARSQSAVKEAAYTYNRFNALKIQNRFSVVFNPIASNINWYIQVPPQN